MSRNLYDLIGLAAGICFILALKGLSSPKSARRGNLIGAIGATVATIIVFFYANGGKALNHLPLILAAIGFGVIVGVPAARKVQMTQMPQLVALFNGVGGGAAALVAIVEYLKLGDGATTAEVVATVFTVIVGCVSFSGSVITFDWSFGEWWLGNNIRWIYPITSKWIAFTAIWNFICVTSWRSRCSYCYFTSKCIYRFNSCCLGLCSANNFTNCCRNISWCIWNNSYAING
jgi:NAD/NADP transhydrogenase beta subunit